MNNAGSNTEQGPSSAGGRLADRPAGEGTASDSSIEDEKLVAAAIEGDESSYSRLVEKYHKALYFFVTKMVREQNQVEDLVQEVFMKAFGNLKSYDSKYAFSTWLYRIASNHSIDYLRKKKMKTLSIDQPSHEGKDQLMQLPDEHMMTDREVIRKERKSIIEKAISDLPENYRKVIVMRHMDEKSYQEISEELNIPMGTVKAHIFRAREMLYKALKDKRQHY